jgi:hypothetical protein
MTEKPNTGILGSVFVSLNAILVSVDAFFTENIYAIVKTVFSILMVIIPMFLILSSFVFNLNQPLDMIRTMSNAILTVSSIILATIIAILTIFYASPTPRNKKQQEDLKLFRGSLLYIVAIPVFGIALGLFALLISYYNYFFALILFALGMEATIAEIFALYAVFYKFKKIFPDPTCNTTKESKSESVKYSE